MLKIFTELPTTNSKNYQNKPKCLMLNSKNKSVISMDFNMLWKPSKKLELNKPKLKANLTPSKTCMLFWITMEESPMKKMNLIKDPCLKTTGITWSLLLKFHKRNSNKNNLNIWNYLKLISKNSFKMFKFSEKIMKLMDQWLKEFPLKMP